MTNRPDHANARLLADDTVNGLQQFSGHIVNLARAYLDLASRRPTEGIEEALKEALREALPYLDEHVGCEIQEDAPGCYNVTLRIRALISSNCDHD